MLFRSVWVEQVQDHTFEFSRVFKDGSQFINVKLAESGAPRSTTPVLNAAVKELDLARAEDEAAFRTILSYSPYDNVGPQTYPAILALGAVFPAVAYDAFTAFRFALELDFIEPRAARRLDEDWGINHSYLFVELYGSLLGSSIPMRDAFTWSAGLGLTF